MVRAIRILTLCLASALFCGLPCVLTDGAAERVARDDAALRETADAVRLLLILAPARIAPDKTAAQQDFINAFPTEAAAFAASLRLTGDAPLDWLLGLARADNRALRQAARQRLRAVDPMRLIRAADRIYAAIGAWPCQDFLELARDGPPQLKMAADAKWRGARTLRRASLPPSAPVSARNLAQALLPLFADPDPDVSATAMLYAARLEAPGPLRAWLLKRAAPEDSPLRKTLTAYCLARWSPLNQDRQLAFLRRMFINWETFWQLVLFEDFTALAAHGPSLDWVCRLSLSPETEARREARDNLLAVHLSLARERREGRLDAHKNQVDRRIFAAISHWDE